jgi:LacI family transcriptional regulator
VLARVKELDYRPNLRARSLATGRSNLIGLIVPDLLHPFFAEAAKALSSVLKESGYYVIISSSEEQPTLEEREIEQYLAQRLDGLIIASCSASPAKFQYLQEQGVPFVLMDRRFSGFRANYVGINDVAAGRMATAHLLSIGSIALVIQLPLGLWMRFLTVACTYPKTSLSSGVGISTMTRA